MKIVNIIPTPEFKREAKSLLKKYVSLAEELRALEMQLRENPQIGDKITENTYKIRLAVKSKGRGKSGGLRIISYIFIKVVENDEITNIYLLSIYDKSDYENVSNKLIAERIRNVLDEENADDIEN
jgi:mRNA-degrading endonuclease RelE of RelBE toxin-antitoxin system